MLIARLTPIGTDRFNFVRSFVTKWNFKDTNPLYLIAPWIMFFSGWVTWAGKIDVNLFWKWSGWFPGITMSILTGALFYFLAKTKRFVFEPGGKNIIDILAMACGGFVLYLVGYGIEVVSGLTSGLPYFAGFLAGMMVYSIPVTQKDENGNFTLEFSDRKIDRKKVLISTVLLIITLLLGLYFRDPVASTSAGVILPFLFITAIGNGIRHLLRTRFYILFIPAMFIVSRIPWLLIPLFIVFYASRIYNYYTREIVYPSFGIDFNVVRHRKGKKN